MTTLGREQILDANRAVHQTLLDEAAGRASMDDVEAAQEQARQVEHRNRPRPAEEIGGIEGVRLFDCKLCGHSTIRDVDDLGVCPACSRRPSDGLELDPWRKRGEHDGSK